MSLHILQCKDCLAYTLKSKCSCGGEAVRPIPPKYSPEDKYGSYRREAKKEMLVKEGLL